MMPITITLDDGLVAQLENKARRQRLSVEEFALGLLAEAVEEELEPVTLQDAVARIQATPPSRSQVRPASGNLADVLKAAPGEPSFDLQTWNRQWSVVEAELKATTRANDIAEGRGV